jgi:hypothetical protein
LSEHAALARTRAGAAWRVNVCCRSLAAQPRRQLDLQGWSTGQELYHSLAAKVDAQFIIEVRK